MSLANCTAHHSINYMDIIFNKTYYEWATLIANRIADLNKKKRKYLKFGTYTLDKLVLQVFNITTYLFSLSTVEVNTISAALYAKMAWETNYIYWRDNKPYLTNRGYLKPKYDIFTKEHESRLDTFETKYDDLLPVIIILEHIGPLDGFGILNDLKFNQLDDYNVLDELL